MLGASGSKCQLSVTSEEHAGGSASNLATVNSSTIAGQSPRLHTWLHLLVQRRLASPRRPARFADVLLVRRCASTPLLATDRNSLRTSREHERTVD